MSNNYVLKEADLDWGRTQKDSPVTRAASNPNSAILFALLKYGKDLDHQDNGKDLDHQDMDSPAKSSKNRGVSPSPWQDIDSSGFYFDSPLMTAIRAELLENVTLLLQFGADPNGLDLQMFSMYSTQFLRFRRNTSKITRTEALKGLQDSQTSPLTVNELTSRSKSRALFWSEEDYPDLSETNGHKLYQKGPPIITALEAAARIGNIPIFDQILAANPDISWWLSGSQTAQPKFALPSFLSISTPLHAAIEFRQTAMLKHILSSPHGFSPNVLPLVSITRCLPPLTATIASCSPPNLDAYDALLAHPSTDPNLLTPLFNLHILHFAAASLSLDLLRLITKTTTLSAATKPSALGHTLLHIACLPFSDTHIQIFAEKVYRSIHDVRTLSAVWKPLQLKPSPILDPKLQWLKNSFRGPKLPALASPELSQYFPAQIECVEFLLESGTQDLSAKDVWGNTALHYLAGHRFINEELLEKLRNTRVIGGDSSELSGRDERGAGTGEDIWKDAKNKWGWTPEDLYLDGKNADEGEREDGVFRAFWTD